MVYIVYGSNALLGTLSLNQIGTSDLKGFALVGRAGFDQLGGGLDNTGLVPAPRASPAPVMSMATASRIC